MKILKYFILTVLIISFKSVTSQQRLNYEIEYSFTDRNNYKCKTILIEWLNDRIFIVQDKRIEGSQTDDTGNEINYKFYNDEWSKIFLQSKSETIIRFPIYGKSIVYKIPNDSSKVVLQNEKKKISNYNCQKATILKGNRIYYVWFTLDIPGKYFPFGLSGTPGTIIEVTSNDENFKITFKSIKKNNSNLTNNKYFNFIKKQKVLSYNDYKNTITKLLCNTKKENYALIAKLGGEIIYEEDQSHFTNQIIDIPNGTVKALQKITQ